jgi:hypothetical protein
MVSKHNTTKLKFSVYDIGFTEHIDVELHGGGYDDEHMRFIADNLKKAIAESLVDSPHGKVYCHNYDTNPLNDDSNN